MREFVFAVVLLLLNCIYSMVTVLESVYQYLSLPVLYPVFGNLCHLVLFSPCLVGFYFRRIH